MVEEAAHVVGRLHTGKEAIVDRTLGTGPILHRHQSGDEIARIVRTQAQFRPRLRRVWFVD